MWFKFLVWFGKKLNIDGAPICRLFNEAKTEHYTLTNDGWVIIQSVSSKATDAIPVFLCNPTLQERFTKELDK